MPYEARNLNLAGATKTATRLDVSEAARARRFVATAALNATDRALLLDILGLVPDGMKLTMEVPVRG